MDYLALIVEATIKAVVGIVINIIVDRITHKR